MCVPLCTPTESALSSSALSSVNESSIKTVDVLVESWLLYFYLPSDLGEEGHLIARTVWRLFDYDSEILDPLYGL